MSISGAALTVERKWWKMISDKERRDVAARMREICHENPDVSLQSMVASAMNECLPEGMEYGPTLAELIDRPTCAIVESYMGDNLESVEETPHHILSCGHIAYGEDDPMFCPVCGAAVTDDYR